MVNTITIKESIHIDKDKVLKKCTKSDLLLHLSWKYTEETGLNAYNENSGVETPEYIKWIKSTK